MRRCALLRGWQTAPWRACWPNCPKSSSTPTKPWSSWPVWRRSPMIAAPRPASAISAADAPAYALFCSSSPISPAASMLASQNSIKSSPKPENQKWSCASRSPESSSYDSMPKHVMRENCMHLQLDSPDSRSPYGRGSRTGIASRFRSTATVLHAREPIVAEVFPVAAGVLVGHLDRDDVLGLLEAE